MTRSGIITLAEPVVKDTGPSTIARKRRTTHASGDAACALPFIELAELVRTGGLPARANDPLPDDTGHDQAARALWALGGAIEHAGDPEIRHFATRQYDESFARARASRSPGPMALALLGATARLRRDPAHGESQALVEEGGDFLANLLDDARRPDWAWFEAVTAHEYPRLPQALIEAATFLDRDDWLTIGVRTLAWIAPRQIAEDGAFVPIGQRDPAPEVLPVHVCRQAIEAHAVIDAAHAAFAATGEPRWPPLARAAWRWFFSETAQACGLTDIASNRRAENDGTVTAPGRPLQEARVAFQLSHCTIGALEAQVSYAHDGAFHFSAE